MKIEKNSVVTVDYRLFDGEGTLLDSSEEGHPIVYLHGHGQILPALEAALDGRQPGDSFRLELSADEAYGQRDEAKLAEVPRSRFPEGVEALVGTPLVLESDDGHSSPAWVREVRKSTLLLDGNHPLCGMDLCFELTVSEARAATAEDLNAPSAE